VKTLVLYPWEYRGTPRPSEPGAASGRLAMAVPPARVGGVMKLTYDPLLRRSAAWFR
jgi:hypothetical protein